MAPADVALALAGLLGLIAFFALLPAQHPHAAARYDLTADEATAEAQALLSENGYPVEDLQARAQFRPNSDLLRSLQKTMGRPATVDTLRQASVRGGLPAYAWRVIWRGEDFDVSENELDDVFSMSLDERGRPWNLSWALDQGRRRPGVNRAALAAVMPASEGADSLAALPDSLLVRHLAFSRHLQRNTGSADEPPDTSRTSLEDLVEALRQQGEGRGFGVPALDRAMTLRLARYHLSRSALADLRLRPDSVWTEQGGPRHRARVRFTSTQPTWGQHVEVTMVVTSVGALRSLEASFEAPPGEGPARSVESDAEEDHPNTITLSAEGAAEGAVYITYGVLFLLVAVLFFRRLSARAIDAQAALRDALWGGLFSGLVVGLPAAHEMLRNLPNLWIGLGILALVVFGSGIAGALVVFVLSGPADTLAREVWPEKIESLSLMRRFSLRNVPVGAALLRGAALAGVLVGLALLALLVFPQAAFAFRDTRAVFLHNLTPSAFGFLFATYGWSSLFYMLMMLVWGTLLYRWKENAALAVGGMVGVFVLGQAGPYTLTPVGYNFALAGAMGTALAVAFWRYDALTCFVGYLLMGLVWGTAPGWLIDGFPEQLDFFLALLTMAATLGIGAVGLRSGRTGKEAGAYTPAYLRELAEQERLKRDIEIAQQVQRDFLPRRMPQVKGLEVAALCLPARKVGGDYYDFIALPEGRLGVVIGDVSGKGIEASFYMTLAKGFLQTLAEEESAPAAVLRRLNTLFCRNAPRGTFITMIYGVVDPIAGTFCFARAGHTPPAYRRTTRTGGADAGDENGRTEGGQRTTSGEQTDPGLPNLPSQTRSLRPRGMAIGLVSGPRFDDVLDEVTLPLVPGDALVLYTDGFLEARNRGGGEFGEKRLLERIRQHGGRPARELLQALTDEVHAFMEVSQEPGSWEASHHDDMTMVVIKRTGSSTASRVASAAAEVPALPSPPSA